MSAMPHQLPARQLARLAVRRYHGFAIGADGMRIETDVDARDQVEAENSFFAHLERQDVTPPFRGCVTIVPGAHVGDDLDTVPSGLDMLGDLA